MCAMRALVLYTHSDIAGRPGVLQFMGLQRVGHDWGTELTELKD